MRKLLLYTILILLVIVAGCSDFSSSGAGLDEQAVELDTLARGEIIQAGESIDIEYIVNETESTVNRLNIVVTGPDSEIVEDIFIEEEPLSGWVEPIELDESAMEGLYTIRFDFYSDDELLYSEFREFFIAPAIGGIRSIASYPPVLYPGGGGLFNAETDTACENCWLKWSLDDDVIAEGAVEDGYSSIEIVAPDAEGVYNLSLEIFPFPPEEGLSYDFESSISKEIPLYVNTEQKSGVNEFEDNGNYFSLYHFRGNLINSADTELSGIEELQASGQPVLSVKNGMFGYYLDAGTSFESEKSGLPLFDGLFQGFSVMFSLIPFNLGTGGDEPAELYYSALEDGSFSLFIGVYGDGRLTTELNLNEERYTAVSSEPVLTENIYSAVTVGVQPDENGLKIFYFSDGVPVGETFFTIEGDSVPWTEFAPVDTNALSRLAGGMEILIDEFGVYRKESLDGSVVDPNQFSRSMELVYGKSLMFAEGFDGELNGIIMNEPDGHISDSSLVLYPGGEAAFPPIFPGYEEVVFRIEVGSGSSEGGEAVFYVDGGDAQITSLEFPPALESPEALEFSLIFSQDSVNLSTVVDHADETGFTGDFSGVGYSIRNNSPENELIIESILVIRKNINSTEQVSEASVKQLYFGMNSTGDKNRS